MTEQGDRQATTLQRPTTDDPEAWKAYWETQGQTWRTEPEIDAERQQYLVERRNITPDIKKSSYPFKGEKLSRADVEWLLTTHENGRGPIDWNDEGQRERNGLDLRGADLRHEDLSDLPLARLHGGLILAEWLDTIEEQPCMASSPMKDVRLKRAQLQKVNLYEIQLQGANLSRAHLQDANLSEAQLQDANLSGARLQGVHLEKAQLQHANLSRAHLQKAYLYGAQLQGANLCEAHLQGAVLSEAELEGVHLNEATLSDEQYGTVLLADTKWGEINLAVLNWTSIKMLGDEREARQRKDTAGNQKDRALQIAEYETAVRANNQLSTALRSQGLNEEAARFAYRAQLCSQYLVYLQLLQNIASQRKLRWIMQTPPRPSGYFNLLAAATMLLVFTFSMWFYASISEQGDSGNFWLIFLLVSGVFCLYFLVTYHLQGRLFLLFLLLSALDLMILYLVLFFLVSTLLDPIWQINLLSLVLLISIIATTLWTAHTTPEGRRRYILNDYYDLAMILWEKVIKKTGQYLYSWLHPFAQLQVGCGRYIFSLFLNALAGYGYRPGRSLFWYLVIIFGFATGYHTIGNIPLLPDAFVISLTSFHGRGFFPGLESKTTLDNPLVVLAAIEAVIGLFIEISFIATFTQRYFGK